MRRRVDVVKAALAAAALAAFGGLTSAQVSALTGRTRPPYDEASLARAIGVGLDPTGAPLHPGMPRYKMTSEQMAALVAFLKRLGGGGGVDPRLSDDPGKGGAPLPLAGPP